ncbi:C39 family peptidase [Corynebacterium glutamicum]|uniref:C39 family peptidase n=1 Tax=Corynebacterium glutamicum TaxID=1718 RepID=UPI00094552BD|nr:C39 family peptidase [Corynebacterium glutamicum]OKX85142.1 hypothetical protein AUO95_00995 [Corynebacterium glutamicum]
MDAHTLATVMGNAPGVDYAGLLPGYLAAMHAAQINNANRAAMFAAQLGHESISLQHMVEIWGPTAQQRTYDGRMGNRRGTSDWSDFRGRGPIQLTGRDNYSSFTRWTRDTGLSMIDFVAEPWRVAEPHWGFLAAAWYWTQAQPQINQMSDAGNIEGVTRAINGGLTGIDDRRARYHRALSFGARLLSDSVPEPAQHPHEVMLEYSRENVTQLTPWNCGPASTETAIQAATGRWVAETQLATELKTHRGGTDGIGQFPPVLNSHIAGANYQHVEMPNDPPTDDQKEKLWEHLKTSLAAGHPVIMNIVSPPTNRPKSVSPSAIDLAYPATGDIYHYVMAGGIAGEGAQRRVWWADSGFAPFGAWISFDQTATLIPPKGYAWSDAPPKKNTQLFLEALMSDTVKSFINPGKSFPASTALSLIDASNWRSEVLTEALLQALGIDTEKILAAAIEADNAGADRSLAIGRALNLKEKK